MSELFENEAATSGTPESGIPTDGEARWYVAHTYSGYENKVKANIEKTVENRNLHDQILEVIVPLETVVEIKDGSKKAAQKRQQRQARKRQFRESCFRVMFWFICI